MITLIAAVAAVAVWFVTARRLYGLWRGCATGKRECRRHGTVPYRRIVGPDCCYDYTAASDGEAVLYAMAAAVFWPVVCLVALVRFRPPATVAERKATAKALREQVADRDKRVADLERELGIRP